MTTYLGFLRAINLGARRKFPKAKILGALEAAGGADPATYINTGNVRVDLPEAPRAEIETQLERAFRAVAGFDVPTVVFTTGEYAALARTAEEIEHPARHYVSLLKQEPDPESVAALIADAGEGERVVVEGRGVHLLLGEDYRSARLTNTAVERHLGTATNRNASVIRTLHQKWC